MLARLETLSFKNNWSIRITASRRTPAAISIMFRQKAKEHGWQFWAGPQDGENPYLAWLLYSDAAIITRDSTNMLSEAAWFGLPIHMADISGESLKIERFNSTLIKQGAARVLGENLAVWDYKPIREGGRVSDVIRQKLLEKWPVHSPTTKP